MPQEFVVKDISQTLQARLFPTVMGTNRLEGRPRRSNNFDRSLRAELRDALWMLTRQWQLGEFQGDDAGSPVSSKIMVEMQPLRKYQPADHAVQPFPTGFPLEAVVERRGLPFQQGDQPISLDLRLLMGRQWLKMAAALGNFSNFYRQQFAIAMPDPAKPEDAQICAHPEVWQQFAAVAGRAMDGYRLYRQIKTSFPASTGVVATQDEVRALDELGQKFVEWFEKLFLLPAPDQDAWKPAYLEYQFNCAADGDRGEQTLTATEYYHGQLDWYNFDLDPAKKIGAPQEPLPPAASTFIRDAFIPVAVTFDGMPNTRWWTFEDGKTNFGALLPNKTDLGKLLLVEFGLIYANDWFLLPVPVETGQTLLVKGLSVTNVFGEHFWIEPAAKSAGNPQQRWRMFTLKQAGSGTAPEDLSLLLLPTVPKIQEGPAVDEILLLRDEVANMVWGVERVVPLASGRSKSGFEAATELRRYLQKMTDAKLEANPNLSPHEYEAPIRYEVMNSVPENWIPFIPVHEPGSKRQIRLQRATMPRMLEGDANPPQPVRPRSVLLREGVDANLAYFLHEEEVPRAGVVVSHKYQRTRWLNGRVVNWLGVRKITGRGEGHSGLAFDQILPTGKQP